MSYKRHVEYFHFRSYPEVIPCTVVLLYDLARPTRKAEVAKFRSWQKLAIPVRPISALSGYLLRPLNCKEGFDEPRLSLRGILAAKAPTPIILPRIDKS